MGGAALARRHALYVYSYAADAQDCVVAWCAACREMMETVHKGLNFAAAVKASHSEEELDVARIKLMRRDWLEWIQVHLPHSFAHHRCPFVSAVFCTASLQCYSGWGALQCCSERCAPTRQHSPLDWTSPLHRASTGPSE